MSDKIDQRIVRHSAGDQKFRAWLEDADASWRHDIKSGLFDVFDEDTDVLRDAFRLGIGPRDFADDTLEWAKRARMRQLKYLIHGG